MSELLNQIELMIRILTFLLPAVPATVKITLLGFTLAVVLGIAGASGRISRSKAAGIPAKIYVNVARGVPLLVQIFFIYFGLGKLLNLDRLLAGVLAIGICYGAYISEIVRAGIQAIPRGQSEAAMSLGLSRFQLWRHILLPQAFRLIIPPLANEFIACLKDSSLVSIIGLRELTRAGTEYYSQHFVDFHTWFLVGLIYLTLTLSLTKAASILEKRFRIPGLGIH